MPKPTLPKLRFAVGDRVLCNCADKGWLSGTIEELFVKNAKGEVSKKINFLFFEFKYLTVLTYFIFFSKIFSGYNELIQQRQKEQDEWRKEKIENEKIKIQLDRTQNQVDGIQNLSNTTISNTLNAPETIDSENMSSTITLPKVRTSPRTNPRSSPRSSNRNLSVQQQKKLQKMLLKSAGGRGLGMNDRTNQSSFDQHIKTKVPMSSPRTWTDVLRGGKNRHVWKDTGDQEMVYKTRNNNNNNVRKHSPRLQLSKMVNGNEMIPRPPVSKRKNRMQASSKSPRRMRSPRYRKHRECLSAKVVL